MKLQHWVLQRIGDTEVDKGGTEASNNDLLWIATRDNETANERVLARFDRSPRGNVYQCGSRSSLRRLDGEGAHVPPDRPSKEALIPVLRDFVDARAVVCDKHIAHAVNGQRSEKALGPLRGRPEKGASVSSRSEFIDGAAAAIIKLACVHEIKIARVINA